MEIKIALAGNPNCGKTTLFNGLTGANQYVGNWPGVTVEKKEGRLKNNKDVVIQDLPGIYSLSPYTLEEVVSRNYLVREKPDAILNIVDGTNIERNLYLTTQLIEVGIPVVIAINMMDVVEKNGDKIDINKLGQALGCKVCEISALKGEHIMDAANLAIEAAKAGREGDLPHVFTGSVEHAIAHIEEALKRIVPKSEERWYAVKAFERDTKALEDIRIPKDLQDEIEGHIKDCEKEMDDDSESIITDQRYNYITDLINKSVKKGRQKGELSVSDKIDRIVTNRWLALPLFIVIMFFVYWLGVGTVGSAITDWTNDVFFGTWIEGAASAGLQAIGASDWIQSLIVDGIINGIATPLGFVPQMAIIFLFLGFLEDCGYMARVAFIMDRIFRRFGLSGKSFIPFIISAGCGVPGIMATRTIESEKDRRMTMMTTTMIPCSAKLPVIAAVAGYVMGSRVWWFAPTCYFAGIALVIIYCIILKKTKEFAGEPVPFVMELPAYHLPTVKSLLLHVWERLWAFIKKAGTILFLCCVVMWFLAKFGFMNGTFTLLDDDHIGNSILAAIGGFLAPIFIPLGFGHWQPVGATLSGFVAKEQLVGTLSIVSSLGKDISDAVTDYSSAGQFNSLRVAFHSFFDNNMGAVSFLLFNIFDSPCLAAISSMAKEIGDRKKFWKAILFQNFGAWCVSLIVYQIIGLIIGEVPFTGWTIVAFCVLAWALYLLFRPDPNKKYVLRDRGETVQAKA